MTQRREWTHDELMHAKRLRSKGYGFGSIDRMLGRHPGSTLQKLSYVERRALAATIAQDGPTSGSIRAPERVLAERDARRDAADRRDVTSTFFGDPPPGYSELDRRRRT